MANEAEEYDLEEAFGAVLCCAPQVPIGTGWFQAVPTGSDQIPSGSDRIPTRTSWIPTGTAWN